MDTPIQVGGYALCFRLVTQLLVISSKLFKNAQSRRHKLLIFVTERIAKLF